MARGWRRSSSAPFYGRLRNRRIAAFGTAYEAIYPAVFDGGVAVIWQDAIPISAHFPSKSGRLSLGYVYIRAACSLGYNSATVPGAVVFGLLVAGQSVRHSAPPRPGRWRNLAIRACMAQGGLGVHGVQQGTSMGARMCKRAGWKAP